MCYFLLATLPAGITLQSINPTADSFGLHFTRVNIPSLQRQFPASETCYFFTNNYCDCHVVIDARRQLEGENADNEISHEMESIRRKGWSEAKIARWYKEKKATADRRNEKRSVVEDYEQYSAFLHQTLSERLTTHIGLLIHFYSGAISAEEIEVTKTVTLPIDRVSAVTLMALEDDVLYIIKQQ